MTIVILMCINENIINNEMILLILMIMNNINVMCIINNILIIMCINININVY